MDELNTIALSLARQHAQSEISRGFYFAGTHSYTYPDGELAFFKIRLNHPEGEKWIRPFHFNAITNRYEMNEPAFEKQKPLYHLLELSKRSKDCVYIVEGETCADKLNSLGFLATTSGSSTSARSADWSPLKGRTIIIWPDKDKAGLQYAADVTEILTNLGCSIKWIDISKLNLPDGGDFIDWLDSHPSATREDVENLATYTHARQSDDTSRNIKSNYPCFEVKNEGVFYCRDSKESYWICSQLIVKALTRDANGVNWGRVLEFKDADNVSRQWTMPMELLSGNGDELTKELLRLGLRIAPGSANRKSLVEYITNAETSERARCVLNTGWHDKCFVLPTKIFGETNELVIMQTDTQISTDYTLSGTLDDWQKHISKKCVGNSRLIFAIALALSPPILKITRSENGGFHLRGESSTGKSTALVVSSSVWGDRNYVHNWRATDNGLEGLAAQHNDTLLVLDELSQIDPRYAGEIAYMLANGQGKARATKFGGVRQRYKWRLLFLSSGEISLTAHMMEAGKRSRAGQEIRMVDLPANAGSDKGIFENIHEFTHPNLFADYLKVSCDKYHGVAGDKFLKEIVCMNELHLHTKIQSQQIKFMELIPKDLHGQVIRVAQRFALVAAVGEIATEFGVTGWLPGIAIQAVKKCFNAWLSEREGVNSSYEKETILEHVRHFFQENAARFDVFDSEQEFKKLAIPNMCAGYRNSSGNFYVFPKTFKDEICKGLGSQKDVIKIVEEYGWLIKDAKTGSAYSSIWVPTQNRTMRLYHFSDKVR